MANFPEDLDLLQCPECSGLLEIGGPASGLRCAGCGRPFPIEDGIPRFCEVGSDIVPSKGASDPGDEAGWSKWRRDNFAFCRDALAEAPGKSLAVDIGAGRGQFRSLFEVFEKRLALDFYPYPGVDVVTDITRRFPLRNDRADVVILSNVLEHTPEPAFLLRECARILRPARGRLIIVVPFIIKIHQAPHDFFRYTPYALDHLIRGAGLKAESIVPLGGLFDVLELVQGAAVRSFARDKAGRRRRLEAKLIGKGMALLSSRVRRVSGKAAGGMGYAQGFGCVVNK